MPKLTDAQLVILSAAAEHEDRALLPLPKSIRLNAGAAATVFKSLLKHGLIAEQPATEDETTWRKTKDGQRVGLVITDAGLGAIGVEKCETLTVAGKTSIVHPKDKSTTPPVGRKQKVRPKASESESHPSTKQEMLIGLLRRKNGATIRELSKATGWQDHSVRGAISGSIKKKLGIAVESVEVKDRGRVYRIVASR